MTVKNQILRIFNLLVLCAVMASPAFAQNLIINGGFESNGGGAIYSTDYERTWGGVVEAGHYAVDYNAATYGGGIGWPEPSGSSGRFMMVNGFGGSINPTKVVWSSYHPDHQYITVVPNATYTFSCRVVNLNRLVQGQINPAKLQLKINDVEVGPVNQLPTHNNWYTWTVEWNSGNATEAVIKIVDKYVGNSDIGDDYALDDMSFVANEVYSVNAVNDTWPLACLWTPTVIPVLDNDIFSPNSSGATVSVVQQPQHGEASVYNSTNIEYIFNDASFTGTDQFKYRVTFHGMTSDAWVYVTVGQPPTVSNITAPSAICAGGALGIPTPTVNPQATGQWESSTTQNGTFTPFDPNNIPLSMNGYWVRYSASNDCGEGHNIAVQITVTNGPSFTGQTPQIQPICAGGSLNLTPPNYNDNGSQILSSGWVASPTAEGTYTTFNPNNVSATYNGYYIRYMVEGSCGPVYSQPARQLVVNIPPDVTGTLQAPEAICDGEDLTLVVPDYDGTGTGAWEISQAPNGTYQPFNPQNVSATYNNWYLHYKVTNDCGSDVSNAVQIHINAAATIATPATPQAFCAGNSLDLTIPSIQNNGSTITDQGWQIAASQNGSYNAFNNNNVQYSYNGYWIRYYAVNECGTTYSQAVQITVNDIPLVGNITAPSAICAGEAFTLTTPTVTWRHTNQGTGTWEIAPTSSGDFTALTNNNIPYAYNGYYLRYKAVNGCGEAYSSNVVQVTVYSTEDTYDEITACDTYIWNGVTCDHTDDYTAQVQNSNGCTITAHLHFILSDAYTETQTFSSCESFTWPVNGQTYYTSQTVSYTVESGNPLVCDSIFTLNLTINNAPEIIGSVEAPGSVCAGSPLNVSAPQFTMNHVEGGDAHWEYATSSSGPFTPFDPSTSNLTYGTYYLRFAVINACDEAFSNVVTFHVDDVPVANMQLQAMQVCQGQSLDLPETNVTWNNENTNDRVAQWQMSSTQNGTYANIDPSMTMQMSHNGYWLRFMAQNSCGNDIVGPVQITVVDASDEWLETITACDSYTLPSGEVINESQTVDYESFDPCFHLVHQPIVINHSDFVVEPITSCHESYEWHGMTFNHSNQTQYATVTLTNEEGCDSIVELHLDFGDYATYTHTRTACGSYVWEMNPGHVYYETQRDSVFVPAVSQDDCDTWYYLDLTLGHDTLVDGGSMTECSGYEWHGVAYYEDAVVYDTLLTAVTRCDSIIAYQLHIIAPYETDTTVVSCQPIWWQGNFCEEEGDYQHVFQSVQGCDSLVVMHFSLADQLVREFDTLACEPFVWYGNQCTNSGTTYEHLFQTAQGCDSLVRMHVTFNEMQVLTDTIRACDYFEIGGVVYDEPGITFIELDTLYSQSGCDSIVQRVMLEIKDSETMGAISGSAMVYVASSLVSGIYRYEIDTTGMLGAVTWTLTNPDWQIVEAANDHCRIYVGTPGFSQLKASFSVEECGEIERVFEINAGFYGLDEHQMDVKLFPNPTKGTLTVESEGIEVVRILNMMGQVVEHREYGKTDHAELNLSTLAPSVYVVEVKTVNGLSKKSVVVCK